MKASAKCRWAGALLAALILSAAAEAQSPTPPIPDDTPRFGVSAVRVEGNTLLPEGELAAVVAPLVGNDRTLADLRKTAASVQTAYRDAGYGGVVAFVPPQQLSGGALVIRVVEGKLARVSISGNQRYDEANIRRSLPGLREGETPRVPAIDRDIQLANENPAKELRVTLTAGGKTGEIDAKIEVAEESPWRILVGLDNTGDPTTGEYRASVGLQHLNLWNLDHIGTVQYQTSPGEPDLVQIYALGYRLPVYGYATSVDAFYGHSSVDNGTTATPAGALQFTGKGDVAGVRVNRYLDRLGEYDHRVTLGLDWRYYDNECALGSFGAAGCGPSGVSVTLVPISLGYTGQLQAPDHSWGFSAAVARNVGGSSQQTFEDARPGANRDYTVFRLSAFAGVELPLGLGLQGRFSGQYSPDALVPGEQFGLGGADRVRGYYEREVVGDYGYILNLEALGPAFRPTLAGEQAFLRPLVFFDYGRVSNHEDAPCLDVETSCTLSSVGVGARFTLGKRVSARLDVARALDDGTRKDAGDTRGHVALQLVF
jgi:hemolysin activation/secretion protein